MDARISLRDKFTKESGKVPDQNLDMYSDWLERQLLISHSQIIDMQNTIAHLKIDLLTK